MCKHRVYGYTLKVVYVYNAITIIFCFTHECNISESRDV